MKKNEIPVKLKLRGTLCAALALLLLAALPAGCAGTGAPGLPQTPPQIRPQTDPAGAEPAPPAPMGDAAEPKTAEPIPAGSADPSGEARRIVLADGASSAEGPGASIDGETVTITQPGVYLVSGGLKDGLLLVDAGKEDAVRLVLEGVSVSSSGPAALSVRSAGRVVLECREGTENSLTALGGDEKGGADAAVYSKSELLLTGGGALTVRSALGHGVVSKESLAVTGGLTLEVSAAKKGLTGKDSLSLEGCAVSVEAGTDGLSSTLEEEGKGTVSLLGTKTRLVVVSGKDGIDAAGDVVIEGGDVRIRAGGADQEGYKGIKSATSLTIIGGALTVEADDDALHSDGSLYIGGGELRMTLTAGDDGMSAKTGLAVTGGETEIDAGGKGLLSALDLTVSGGSLRIRAGDDGIHADGSAALSDAQIRVAAADDGVHADGILQILSGSLEIERSYEGLEAEQVWILGGAVRITASDDGINAGGGRDGSNAGGPFGGDRFGASSNAGITISGGKVYVDSGGDGLDSNGSLTVTGGELYVDGPVDNGNGALDYDTVGVITGGTVVALGSPGMAVNFSAASSQGTILLEVGSQAAGTSVSIRDEGGAVLASFSSAKRFGAVTISAPGMVSGGTYVLTVGDASYTVTLDGTVYGRSRGPGGGRGR